MICKVSKKRTRSAVGKTSLAVGRSLGYWVTHSKNGGARSLGYWVYLRKGGGAVTGSLGYWVYLRKALGYWVTGSISEKHWVTHSFSGQISEAVGGSVGQLLGYWVTHSKNGRALYEVFPTASSQWLDENSCNHHLFCLFFIAL